MFVDFNILNQLGSPAINSNTFANRPAAGQTGRLFVSTDTYEIYRDNGTTWDLIGGPGSSTITGTGTATQVAYFTAAQAIGSSANLFWDNTNTRLGVGTATPGYTIEANGDILAEAIYLDGATAGNGALYWTSDRVTLANYNASGIVHIETNGGTAAAIFAANYTATFTSGIGTNGYTGSTSYAALFNGSIGVGIATPSGLIHADGGASAARIILDADTGVARIFSFRTDNLPRWALRVDGTETGSNAGADFALRAYDDTGTFTFAPMSVTRATGKTTFQATQTYTTGLARGNYFDYNLSVSAGGSFSSPNAITALGASLDLTLAGSATIPSGARSGLDAYNSVAFTGTGTLTQTQGTQIRAYSNLTAGWAFNGSAIGTITHLAGLRVLFPDNTGSAVTITNNYALLLNDQTANTGTVTYTNRWGVYQEGTNDTNYFAATTLVGTTVSSGYKFNVSGSANATTLYENGVQVLTTANISGTTNYIPKFTSSSAIGNSIMSEGSGEISVNGGIAMNGTMNIKSSNVTRGYFGDVDGDNNIQLRAENALTIKTGGNNERLRISSTGNVGIGTTSPNTNSKLTISASTSVSSYWQATSTNAGARDWSIITNNVDFGDLSIRQGNSQGADATSGTTRLYIKNDGSVGIGTTSPTSKLQINSTSAGAATVGLFLNNESNTSSTEIRLAFAANTNNDISTDRYSYISAINTSGGNGQALKFATNEAGNSAVERMRITSGGEVGINTSSPTNGKLEIQQSATTAGLWVQTGGTTSSYTIADFRTGSNLSALSLLGNGNAEFGGSIKTAAPSGGTAGSWKLGSRVSSSMAFDSTQYIEVDIGGTLYKLAIATPA